MDSVPSTPHPCHGISGNDPPHQQPPISNGGPQIRSRITVVCGECKRLKLKCDRRNPCGSCSKRDTIPRCIYSTAAAEKIDLQSLNNRLITVENALANFQSASPFSYQVAISSSTLHENGSSFSIAIQDVTSIWLDELTGSSSGIKSEQSDNDHCLASASSYSPIARLIDKDMNHLLPPLSAYPTPFHVQQGLSSLTPHLPASKSVVKCLLDRVETYVRIRGLAGFSNGRGWDIIRGRVERVLGLPSTLPTPASKDKAKKILSAVDKEKKVKADLARAIFFGTAVPSAAPSSSAKAKATKREKDKVLASDSYTGVDDSITSFALTAALLALGALLDCIDGHGSLHNENSSSNPAYLHAISKQALNVAEGNNSYDLDFLLTCLFQVGYVIIGAGIKGNGSTGADGLFPLVGKMVNVARQLDLSRDPDDLRDYTFGKTEKEMRRGAWWDVLYYDLFVSDCMGHPPLVAEAFTTQIPRSSAEGEEEAEYFSVKCRLAQLVKRVKAANNSPDHPYTIDRAALLENQVRAFLDTLPSSFRLSMSDSMSSNPGEDAILVAQKCEIAITAHRLILKLYVPFLRPLPSGQGGTNLPPPPYQATHGTVNAAHVIVHACRVLHQSVRSQPKESSSLPAIFDLYSFPRTLFDSAVVCAHAAVKQPSTIWAASALDDVTGALSVMYELGQSLHGNGASGIGLDARGNDHIDDKIRIMEGLYRRAETAKNGDVDVALTLTSKRKRVEVESSDDDELADDPGSQLPSAHTTPVLSHSHHRHPSGALPSSSSRRGSIIAIESEVTSYSNSSPMPPPLTSSLDKSKSKEKDKDRKSSKHAKKGHYPSIGIRVRKESGPSPLAKDGGDTIQLSKPSTDEQTRPPALYLQTHALSDDTSNPQPQQQQQQDPPQFGGCGHPNTYPTCDQTMDAPVSEVHIPSSHINPSQPSITQLHQRQEGQLVYQGYSTPVFESPYEQTQSHAPFVADNHPPLYNPSPHNAVSYSAPPAWDGQTTPYTPNPRGSFSSSSSQSSYGTSLPPKSSQQTTPPTFASDPVYTQQHTSTYYQQPETYEQGLAYAGSAMVTSDPHQTVVIGGTQGGHHHMMVGSGGYEQAQPQQHQHPSYDEKPPDTLHQGGYYVEQNAPTYGGQQSWPQSSNTLMNAMGTTTEYCPYYQQ